jgi:hypothetical protein
MHWDRNTGELFGARPIPQPSYPAFRPSKFIVTDAKPNEVTGESEAVGKWFEEEHVPKSLRVGVKARNITRTTKVATPAPTASIMTSTSRNHGLSAIA